MIKQKYINTKKIILLAVAVVFLVASFAAYANPASSRAEESTEDLRNKAQVLEDQINSNNKQAEALALEADALKRKIGELDIQISTINAEIQLTTVKLAELQLKLDEAQKELDRQKDLLKASVRALYKKSGASTVELLIGSESFTQFFNEQTYLEKLKAGVQESTEKIIDIKQQIQAQKEQQKSLLKQQKAQQKSLADSKIERERILKDTEGRESAYRERSRALVDEQRTIFNELLLRSRVISTIGSGGYPWTAATCVVTGSNGGSCGDYEWSLDGRVLDPWGYYLRNCTSYVAWRVASTGKDMPSGLGNGGNWVNSANAYGIETSNRPKVGAAAVFSVGYYGHVVYVEEVLEGGSKIRVSEYNFVQDGIYSERIMSASVPTGYVYL